MMDLKEYARKLAEEIAHQPTQSKMFDIVNRIFNLKVDEQPISSAQIELLLKYLENEIGDLQVLNESFENKAAISFMAEIRKLIAQSNKGGKGDKK